MDEVADSTDWLNTPLSGLASIEQGLRCQVCKDFFTTPMITSCAHTFCSLCIRRYLSQEGRCPACRESDQEMKLRPNWTVEDLVSNFQRSRDQILAFARQPPPQPDDRDSGRPKKRRKVESTVNGTERRSTRSQSKRLATSASQASQEPLSTQEEVADSEDDGSVYQDQEQPNAHHQQSGKSDRQPNDGLVACPCCNRRMKETAINAHLDRCIQGLPTSPDPPTAPAPITATNTASLAFAQRTKSPVVTAQKDRLPSINYALFTEASLRKKLKELAIPNHGNKDLMRKRHTEWVNLWNANCDSSRPRTKRDLLKDLDVWERTQGRQLERGIANGNTGVMVKEFDRDGWVKSQKGEFDDLIKKARAKKKATAEPTTDEHTNRPIEAEENDTKMIDVLKNGDDVLAQQQVHDYSEASSREDTYHSASLKQETHSGAVAVGIAHPSETVDANQPAPRVNDTNDGSQKRIPTIPRQESLDLTTIHIPSSPIPQSQTHQELHDELNATPGRKSKFFT